MSKIAQKQTPWLFDKSAWTKPHMCGEVITVQLRTGTPGYESGNATENVIVDQMMNAWGRIEVKLVTKNDSEIHQNSVLCWKMIGG